MGDLRAIDGGRKPACIYCGGEAHPVPLACPRISMIHVDPDTATITGISFVEDFFDGEEIQEPDPAA